MLTYLSSYLAMASAFYYVIFEGVMSIVDPGFHDYFIPHSFDVSLTGCASTFIVLQRTCRNPDQSTALHHPSPCVAVQAIPRWRYATVTYIAVLCAWCCDSDLSAPQCMPVARNANANGSEPAVLQTTWPKPLGAIGSSTMA
jgi:hypothetical protein